MSTEIMVVNDAKTKVHYMRDSLRAMVGWRQNLEHTVVPEGKTMPPLVWEDSEKLPVLGPLVRMKQITVDPVGLVRRLARRHPQGFTIRVPSTPDFTFLFHEDAYRLVMSLPATHGAIGQILDRMPTVGYWFPRSGAGPDSLQELIIAGRRMIGEMLPATAMPELAGGIGGVLDRHAATWGHTIDLTTRLYPVVYEASCRYFTGEEIWDDLGEELTRLYRDIVKGIEITHIAASQTAGQYFMPEYRATRRLHRLLRNKLPRYRDADSPLIKAIRRVRVDGKPLSAADSLWMFMYVLLERHRLPRRLHLLDAGRPRHATGSPRAGTCRGKPGRAQGPAGPVPAGEHPPLPGFLAHPVPARATGVRA